MSLLVLTRPYSQSLSFSEALTSSGVALENILKKRFFAVKVVFECNLARLNTEISLKKFFKASKYRSFSTYMELRCVVEDLVFKWPSLFLLFTTSSV